MKNIQDDSLLKVNDQITTEGQAKVLLCGIQQKYVTMFGNDSWSVAFGEGTLEQYVKEQAKIQLVQLATMNVLAKEKEITLTDSQKEQVSAATSRFMSGFSEEQLKKIGITESDVKGLYRQYAMAEGVYDAITDGADQEISDDQARKIDIQVIFCAYPQKGNEALTKDDIVHRAETIVERAAAGDSFESLAAEFNDGSQLEYHMGRGEMEEAFEKAAFQLANDEVSTPVKTKDGVYVIKCISNYNQAETDANKVAIYNKQCAELFNKEYNQFVAEVKLKFNEEKWNDLDMISEVSLPAVDFLGCYESVTP